MPGPTGGPSAIGDTFRTAKFPTLAENDVGRPGLGGIVVALTRCSSTRGTSAARRTRRLFLLDAQRI